MIKDIIKVMEEKLNNFSKDKYKAIAELISTSTLTEEDKEYLNTLSKTISKELKNNRCEIISPLCKDNKKVISWKESNHKGNIEILIQQHI